MRTLERITVTGYKSIKELRDFELGDLNVLIGANGAGKSNLLSVFKLLNRIVHRRLQFAVGVAGGADFLLHFGRKNTKQINLSFLFKRVSEYQLTLFPTELNGLIIERETLRNHYTGGVNEYSSGKEESTLFEGSGILVALIGGSLTFEVYQFHDTSNESSVKQNADIYDNSKLKPDAKNLASFLYLLKNHHQVYYSRILSTVKLAAPFIEDFILNPMPENAQRIRLRWQHKNAEDDFDISQLSDGTLRFICLTALLLQPNPPSLIIIDEPELGLHPAAMELLVEMLRSVATKSQVIISTQSVSMVNQFLPEEIIVVDQEKDESVFSRKSSKELAMWLDEYSMGELWEMNVIGGRP